MLVNQQLKKLCMVILNGGVDSEKFGNLLVEAGIKLEEKEWDVANKLLEKSDEISHAVGGKDKRTMH